MKVLNIDANNSNHKHNLNKGNWIIWLHADWCGHCVAMKDEWSKMEQKLKKHNNINCAKIEADAIKDTQMSDTPVQGFPHIQMRINGKNGEVFNQPRNSENLVEFAVNNSNNNSNKSGLKSKKRKTRSNKGKKRKSYKKRKSTQSGGNVLESFEKGLYRLDQFISNIQK